VDHPAGTAYWYRSSNYLVVLSSDNLAYDLARIQSIPDVVVTTVIEPDLPGSPMTAFAVGPSLEASRLLSSLPLALKVLPVKEIA
jgi:hypothetical protein